MNVPPKPEPAPNRRFHRMCGGCGGCLVGPIRGDGVGAVMYVCPHGCVAKEVPAHQRVGILMPEPKDEE